MHSKPFVKSLFLLLISLAIFLLPGPRAYGLECRRPEKGTEDSIHTLLRGVFPVRMICRTPVESLYEVIGERNRIIYVDPSSGSIFLGILIRDGKNLTDMRQVALNREFVKSLPLDRAVKMGKGPKVVIEFSDPDCPFCRRAHQYFKEREDVTVYAFLFPLTQIHPQAYRKALHILCSDDPAGEYDKVFTGQYDNRLDELKSCQEKAPLLKEHMRLGTQAGVEGTPSFFIDGRFISGFNRPIIERLLGPGSPSS